MTTAIRPSRSKMTEQEAKTFRGYSVANAVAIRTSLECGCQPYQDVYTYARWRALGYQVQKGQHSIRIPVIVERESEEEAEKILRLFRTAYVFCRCQVALINGH